MDFCPTWILCYLLRGSIFHRLTRAIKTRDKPIDLNPLVVSGEPVGIDTWRFISQSSSIDKLADQNIAAGGTFTVVSGHMV